MIGCQIASTTKPGHLSRIACLDDLGPIFSLAKILSEFRPRNFKSFFGCFYYPFNGFPWAFIGDINFDIFLAFETTLFTPSRWIGSCFYYKIN